jgi:uncharacterized protein (DUF433 family)
MERIVLNPKILDGKPIIRGTRISVQFVLELLSSGMDVVDILAEYPHLTRDDVWAALNYAAHTVANEEIVIPLETVAA